jgi:exodeoxyribonuclease VII small subunit
MAKAKESISKKIKELDEILTYFEKDSIDLDDGIKKYERAVKLADSIKKQLSGYEERINQTDIATGKG